MTHLRRRGSGPRMTTWVSVGVRGEEAARTIAEARSHAQARGLTFGSVLMEALAQYMCRALLAERKAHWQAQRRD